MRLYYTTAQAPEQPQEKTGVSLGGFKSSSLIPNGSFGNMFGDISQQTIISFNQNVYIGLILRNDLSIPINNVKLWFTYPTGVYSKFRVAVVDLIDNGGVLSMERVPNKYSKPLMANFVEADGEMNKIDVANFVAGGQIGLWFERELLLDFIKSDQKICYELQPGYTDRYQEKPLSKEDDIKLNLSWD